MLVFMLIYGRMIFSSFSEESGFYQKESYNITSTTISGDIDGEYF